MIEQYINYLRNIRGYSENTCKAYENDLRDFISWAKANVSGARWSTLTRKDIDNYVTAMVAQELKPATTNRRLAAISGIYNYFRREGKQVENPCKYESRRKKAETIPNTIPVSDIRKAWENANGVAKVMLGLLASTGIRIQELLDMTWENIDFESCSIKINGKGSKQRLVYTTPEHLETLKTLHDMGGRFGRIFTMEQRSARRIIFDALKPFSSAPQLSPHAIRHTMATNLANHGANVTTIATILGHKQIETTQKYIDMTQANCRQLCQQYTMFN